MRRINRYPKGLDTLQKISVSIMAFLVMLTFIGANLHALLWQQSTWLVSTVLPAVVVNLTNAEREDINAPELRRNTVLDQAAQLKAEHMAKNEYFSHYSPDGVSPWYWFSEAGYVYAHAGENLAIHFTDSSEVVEAWMKSPTHRANIVNANYTEIGVGTAKGSYEGYNTVYVVQLFGAPAIAPAVSQVPTPVAERPPEATTDTELSGLIEEANELAELVASLSDSADPVPNSVPAELPVEEVLVVEPVAPPETVTNAPAPDELVQAEAPVEEVIPTQVSDVLVVESTIATSSGLAIASVSEPSPGQAGSTLLSIATQPSQLLQVLYLVLGMLVMALLLFSAVFEARQLHFVQVTYSVALMVSMGALWYVHSLLTSGAVIA
jgi:hypothetical protein